MDLNDVLQHLTPHVWRDFEDICETGPAKVFLWKAVRGTAKDNWIFSAYTLVLKTSHFRLIADVHWQTCLLTSIGKSQLPSSQQKRREEA